MIAVFLEAKFYWSLQARAGTGLPAEAPESLS
jgi:hypothetical protein